MDSNLDDGAILLRRTSLAIRAVMAMETLDEALKFYKSTILDFASPQALAVWHAGTAGDCQLIGSCGFPMALPTGYSDWCALNNRAIVGDCVVTVNVDGPNGERLTHVVIPSVLPGRSYLALHLAMDSDRWTTAPQFAEGLALQAHVLQLFVGRRDDSSSTAEPLTPRQQEIYDRISLGHTYRKIGEDLGYSESTIKQEALKVFHKLGVADRRSIQNDHVSH